VRTAVDDTLIEGADIENGGHHNGQYHPGCKWLLNEGYEPVAGGVGRRPRWDFE
jgi:hypothetical protein